MEEKIIFKTIAGSQAQGTSLPESDIDYKGIFRQTNDEILSFGYKEYVEVSKDESYYEIKRFLELLMVANPNAIEILFSPSVCILEKTPEFELLFENRFHFLTKKCLNTFGGYAKTQIVKSKNLTKKVNWELESRERKEPIDFIHCFIDGKTKPITEWLLENNIKQEDCGLTKVNNFLNSYNLYHSEGLSFNGIIGENSNELRLSSIPKGLKPKVLIAYNQDGYSVHCKKYKEYINWLENRNINRYNDNVMHQQIYDSKNLSHCVRLLDIAKEIPQIGDVLVRRNNVEELISIKKGKVPLDEIIEKALLDIEELPKIYANSKLPEDVDKNFVNSLLLKIRKMDF